MRDYSELGAMHAPTFPGVGVGADISQIERERYIDPSMFLNESAVPGNPDEEEPPKEDAKEPIHPAWYVAGTVAALAAGYGIYRAVT